MAEELQSERKRRTFPKQFLILIMLLVAGTVQSTAADLWSRSSSGYLYPTTNTDTINVTGIGKNSTFFGDVVFNKRLWVLSNNLKVNGWNVCLADSTNCFTVAKNVNVTNSNFTNINNIKATSYHNILDWISVPTSITLTGTIACNDLDNLISGVTYTCVTCTDAVLGGTIACSTTASVAENCACRVD